jgi:uncharacterized membrane protein
MYKFILPIGFFVLFLFSSPARAELRFCNIAPLTIQTAVGRYVADKWQSEGWWTLKSGECANVVGGDLTQRYYYAFAETPGSRRKWVGDTPFCIKYGSAFTIVDDRCTSDALRNFDKIDTGGVRSFTYTFSCSQCLDSRLVYAVQRNLPFLEGLANNAAPLSYRTNDWQDVGPADIQYGVSRSPFHLNINGNEVSISTRLSYWLSVSHTRMLGIRTGLASCGINEPQPTADVTVRTIFGITENLKLTSKTYTNLSFSSRCNLTIFNIDATPYIQQVAQPQLDRIASTIDSRISEIDVSRVLKVNDLY